MFWVQLTFAVTLHQSAFPSLSLKSGLNRSVVCRASEGPWLWNLTENTSVFCEAVLFP